MPESGSIERCRLVLVLALDHPAVADGRLEEVLSGALTGGDVASVILSGEATEGAEDAIVSAQAFGAAVMVTDPALLASADGLHLPLGDPRLRVGSDPRARSDEGALLGLGNIESRHAALEAGEREPAYVFFGRLHRDVKPEPHPRGLDLARWWTTMVEVPAIVPGGSEVGSVRAVAATGADFVAMSSAIFDANEPGVWEAGEAVRRANALLDAAVESGEAPRFGT